MQESKEVKVGRELVAQIYDLAENLPEVEQTKEELSLREFIAQSYEAILLMRQKSYSYERIVQIIADKFELTIAVATLQNYMCKETKARRSTKRKSSMKAQQAHSSPPKVVKFEPKVETGESIPEYSSHLRGQSVSQESEAGQGKRFNLNRARPSTH